MTPMTTEALTEEHIQALLSVRAAERRNAPHPPIGQIVAGTLSAYGLVHSDGKGGLQITDKGTIALTNRFLFCEQTRCFGILWRRDVVAPMYAASTVEHDSEGRQFIACPVCRSRNVLDPLALKRNTFNVIEVVPPPPMRGPLSSHGHD